MDERRLSVNYLHTAAAALSDWVLLWQRVGFSTENKCLPYLLGYATIKFKTGIMAD